MGHNRVELKKWKKEKVHVRRIYKREWIERNVNKRIKKKIYARET